MTYDGHEPCYIHVPAPLRPVPVARNGPRDPQAMVLGSNPEVGTAFPDVGVDIGFLGLDPKHKHTTGSLNKGKKNLWVGLPGAFTPT